jgi:hypothetical protein
VKNVITTPRTEDSQIVIVSSTTDDNVFIVSNAVLLNAAQFCSLLRHINEFSDLWRRVAILSEDETPSQITGAVEDVGGATALACYVAGFCPVLERVDRDPFAIDPCNPQGRVTCWSIRIAICLIDSIQVDAQFVRIDGPDNGIRFQGLRDEIQSGRSGCGADQERRY